ncbi:MAG: class I SAM-dependent methyltransferase [Candidatus Odinarchaeia archaeon]
MLTWYQEAVDRIKKNLPLKNIVALDIGTGLGYFSFELSKIDNIRINAIDLNINNLKGAKLQAHRLKIDNVNFILMNGEFLSFRDNTFDLIVSAFSLQYWSKPIKILNEINRLLKKEGFFLITDLRRDMSTVTLKKIAELSAAQNNEKDVKKIELFLKLRLKHCYTIKEVTKLAKKSKLKNWRLTKRSYGFYLESLPRY